MQRIQSDIVTRFKSGKMVSDAEFDLLYSPSMRRLSRRHWTPVNVASRAALLLSADNSKARILDIGSGVGKFCIVGSLTTSASFTGIEQRLYLMEEAQRVCMEYGISSIEFMHGNMVDLDWAKFDAFYFYNPFFENVAAYASIDHSMTLSFEHYAAYVNMVKAKLEKMPIGTKVATYHGFGGEFPDCYDLEIGERIGNDQLNVWIKARNTSPMPAGELSDPYLDQWRIINED